MTDVTPAQLDDVFAEIRKNGNFSMVLYAELEQLDSNLKKKRPANSSHGSDRLCSSLDVRI
jgi:hypothetical protein